MGAGKYDHDKKDEARQTDREIAMGGVLPGDVRACTNHGGAPDAAASTAGPTISILT